MRIPFSLAAILTLLSWSLSSATLDYYRGNDFAILRPVAESAIDESGNQGDTLAVVLDRPTLLFDPAANSFEQRVILKYRVPDFAAELENRLLHQALLILEYAGQDSLDCPLLLATAVNGGKSEITASDFQASGKGTRLKAGRLASRQKIQFDLTSAFRQATPGGLLTIVLQFPQADQRVELPIVTSPLLELRLAKQIHIMRNGTPRERLVAMLDDANAWSLELLNASEDAKASLSTTTEFTFYGAPALKVDCHNLDSATELVLTPKERLDLGGGFELLELWSWCTQFSYGIGRTIKVCIADETGKEHTRDLAMKLAVRGPFPHICDFRTRGEKFDTTRKYRLKYISVRNFTGAPKDDFFGLGPLIVSPNRKSDLSVLPSADLPISNAPESMAPPVADVMRNAFRLPDGGYRFTAQSASGEVSFLCRPATGTLADFTIECNGECFLPMADGGLRSAHPGSPEKGVTGKLANAEFDEAKGILKLVWQDTANPGSHYTWTVRLVHRSLAIDIAGAHPDYSGVCLGHATGLSAPELVNVPYFWFNGVKNGRFGPAIVHSNGMFFYGGMDFFLSNANDFYSDSRMQDGKATYNGGSNYMCLADLTRLPVRDRVILSASTRLHEVFPHIPTKVIHDTGKARDFYFWGVNWVDESRVKLLRAMGLDHLFFWLFWTKSPADNPIDANVRHAHGDPDRFSYQSGKDAEPSPELFRGIDYRKFAASVRANGNLFGIYTYYTDATPNLFDFDPNALQRNFGYQPGMGCLGSYRLRPDCIPGHQRQMSRSIRQFWGPLDGVYTDVLTIRAFWGGTVDLEPGHPFSGKSHFAASAALAKQELEDNGGLAYSEGHLQWLYAGLTSGSYGSLMTPNPKGPSALPMLPEFTAHCIAPKSILVGMSPGAYQFFARADKKLPHGNFRNEQVRQFYAALVG
ncbi:MAG: hypothetical protein IJJ33_18370, partial [Victivallales bacterium]|nr:hypothetical protein [Victivallales bacterium]